MILGSGHRPRRCAERQSGHWPPDQRPDSQHGRRVLGPAHGRRGGRAGTQLRPRGVERRRRSAARTARARLRPLAAGVSAVAYRELLQPYGVCPLEAGMVGALANHECRRGNLARDRVRRCGCFMTDDGSNPVSTDNGERRNGDSQAPELPAPGPLRPRREGHRSKPRVTAAVVAVPPRNFRALWHWSSPRPARNAIRQSIASEGRARELADRRGQAGGCGVGFGGLVPEMSAKHFKVPRLRRNGQSILRM
jgi:hypothetical protein